MSAPAVNAAVRQAADRIWDAHQRGEPCAPVRELIGATDVDAAYAVQKLVTERWLVRGRRPVGRKIGLTSLAVQRQLGVGEPDFGMLFSDMVLCDGDEVAYGQVLQPKVEAEIALVLERSLPHEHNTVADILRAVACALPAIEIVGSRIAGWDIQLADTIADNASSGMLVLGSRPVRLADFDISACGMVVELRGEQVSLGAGAACLGNPLRAAIWLADTMARLGSPLQAGDIIMTGALGPMAPARPGDVFEASIEGLGSVRAAFGPGPGPSSGRIG